MKKQFLSIMLVSAVMISLLLSLGLPFSSLPPIALAAPGRDATAANFSGDPTSGTAPLQVDFSDGSTETPTGWAWYFGDEAFNEPWTQMTTAIKWTARYGHTSVALPDGSIVLMGGWDVPEPRNDVWRSTDQGATWTQMTAAAGWDARTDHTSVALPDGSIVLMGGYDGSYLNDVWRSTDQGATWTQMTPAAEWAARGGHTSVPLPDGGIVLMGGVRDDISRLRDVWRSTDQGATWTQMTAAADWTKRFDHTSVALPDESIVLMGGLFGVGNDVWRSTDQGATWTQMTPAAEWAARGSHTSVALPDGSIVLMGGENSRPYPYYVRFNDVWRSTDQGATWIQLTAAAEWLPRFDHTSVVLPDGNIVLMGGQYLFSDVWRSTDQGATWSTLPDELKIFLPLILH